MTCPRRQWVVTRRDTELPAWKSSVTGEQDTALERLGKTGYEYLCPNMNCGAGFPRRLGGREPSERGSSGETEWARP